MMPFWKAWLTAAGFLVALGVMSVLVSTGLVYGLGLVERLLEAGVSRPLLASAGAMLMVSVLAYFIRDLS